MSVLPQGCSGSQGKSIRGTRTDTDGHDRHEHHTPGSCVLFTLAVRTWWQTSQMDASWRNCAAQDGRGLCATLAAAAAAARRAGWPCDASSWLDALRLRRAAHNCRLRRLPYDGVCNEVLHRHAAHWSWGDGNHFQHLTAHGFCHRPSHRASLRPNDVGLWSSPQLVRALTPLSTAEPLSPPPAFCHSPTRHCFTGWSPAQPPWR